MLGGTIYTQLAYIAYGQALLASCYSYHAFQNVSIICLIAGRPFYLRFGQFKAVFSVAVLRW